MQRYLIIQCGEEEKKTDGVVSDSVYLDGVSMFTVCLFAIVVATHCVRQWVFDSEIVIELMYSVDLKEEVFSNPHHLKFHTQLAKR